MQSRGYRCSGIWRRVAEYFSMFQRIVVLSEVHWICIQRHGVISQKNWIFSNTAVTTSNLAFCRAVVYFFKVHFNIMFHSAARLNRVFRLKFWTWILPPDISVLLYAIFSYHFHSVSPNVVRLQGTSDWKRLVMPVNRRAIRLAARGPNSAP